MDRAKPDFTLSINALEIPRRAHPPKLEAKWALAEAAQCVLRETFAQFQFNLNAFALSADPEVLHQARIGWRRFKSVLRLFKLFPGMKTAPPWQALQALLVCMGDMRDLDVALHDTLPPLEAAYSGANAERKQKWRAMTLALTQANSIQRQALQAAFENPATVTAIELTSRWIEALTVANTGGAVKGRTNTRLRNWARRRVDRLNRELHRALQQTDTPAHEHQVRILAKRLRYSIELFRPLLAKQCWSNWYPEAMHLQSNLGAGRDLMQARLLIDRLDVDPGISAFLLKKIRGLNRDHHHLATLV